jgi:site-specific recombinase XerD
MSTDLTNTVSRNSLGLSALSEGAREYIKCSARPNTRRAYATQIKQWVTWCERQGLVDFPADPASVANYLTERAEAGQAASTLRIVVAALKAGHDAKGLPFDSKAPAILRTLRGIGNSNPRLPKQAEPLRSTDVLGLMESADATPLGLRDAALLALG